MINATIAETQPVYAEGLFTMLSQMTGLHLNRSTNSYQELLDLLRTDSADLLLLDAELNDSIKEEQLIHQLRKEFPELKIILFGKSLDLGHLPRLRRAGLDAYLHKNISCQELLKAISIVVNGGHYLQESIRISLNCFCHDFGASDKKEDRKLTKRESEILGLIVEEYTNQEIAKQLFISIPTVESHRKKLIEKLGVKNTAGLVREAIYRHWYRTENYGKP